MYYSLYFQFLILRKNIYEWYNQGTPLSTDVLVINLFVINRKLKSSIKIRSLNNPLDIFFKLKSSQFALISGQVVAPIKGKQDDDLWVRVYRLENAGLIGNGEWRIMFKNLKQNEYFMVC